MEELYNERTIPIMKSSLPKYIKIFIDFIIYGVRMSMVISYDFYKCFVLNKEKKNRKKNSRKKIISLIIISNL